MRPAHRQTVAIVIPCFDQGRFLARAIESAFAQTVPSSEVIVIDDGSSEDLSAITSRYSAVRLVRQENRGLAGARNRGLREARSDKIIFLDSDDRLLPDAVRLGLECFDDHPDAAFVYGGHVVVEGESEWPQFVRVADYTDLIRCNWIACIHSAMFDRAKLLDIGGFDESLKMAEDWDAFLRLSSAHSFGSYEEPVALYFKHDSNMSNDEAELLRWSEVVRERQLRRGLSEEQLAAWEEGGRLLRSIYDRRPASLLRRLARNFARWLRWK